MSERLKQRLIKAKEVLDQTGSVLLAASNVSSNASKNIDNVISLKLEIDSWLEIVAARDLALNYLDGLETGVDTNDCVIFNNSPVKFNLVRLLGVQNYLAVLWALSDAVSKFSGIAICSCTLGHNPKSPPKLHDFIKGDKSTTIAPGVFYSIKHTFGWPVGILYALRNHFLHDGGQERGNYFFEGTLASGAFKISREGWEKIIEKATEEYKVESTFYRVGAYWPPAPHDDLREIFKVCQKEMDDALGILVGTACGLLSAHVAYLVGEN